MEKDAHLMTEATQHLQSKDMTSMERSAKNSAAKTPPAEPSDHKTAANRS